MVTIGILLCEIFVTDCFNFLSVKFEHFSLSEEQVSSVGATAQGHVGCGLPKWTTSPKVLQGRADRKWPEHLPPPRRREEVLSGALALLFPFAPVAAAERGGSMCAVSGAIPGPVVPDPRV